MQLKGPGLAGNAGFLLAEAQGLYTDAGLEVRLLPPSDAPPELSPPPELSTAPTVASPELSAVSVADTVSLVVESPEQIKARRRKYTDEFISRNLA